MADKKKQKEEEAAAAAASLEQLVLDRKFGKYQVVDRISHYAKELRKEEQHRHLTQTEILELAMREVLGGKVDEEDLDKKIKAAAAANGAKKDAEKKTAKK